MKVLTVVAARPQFIKAIVVSKALQSNDLVDTVQGVLKKILEMQKTELLEIAKHSRKYVEKWHNPLTIAERLKTDMEGAL